MVNRSTSEGAARRTVATWIVAGVAALAAVGLVLRLTLGGLASAENTESPSTITESDTAAAPPRGPVNLPEDLAQGSYAKPEIDSQIVRLDGFRPLGNTIAPAQRDRCSDAARSEMATMIQEIGEGEVVIRESSWNRQATSGRVGIASWLSQCTQQGRPIQIRGDESGNTLARYDRLSGYEEGAKDR